MPRIPGIAAPAIGSLAMTKYGYFHSGEGQIPNLHPVDKRDPVFITFSLLRMLNYFAKKVYQNLMAEVDTGFRRYVERWWAMPALHSHCESACKCTTKLAAEG
jgi:hypothetical protein